MDQRGADVSTAIARVTSLLCMPYGYTLALWCGGAIAVADHGMPGRLEVLLFAVGGVAAFLFLALVGRSHFDHLVPMRVRSPAVANASPVLVAALLAAIPLRALGKPAAFLTTSFVATTVYIVSAAALVRSPGGPADP
jgi:hypothetical protein